MSDLLVRRATTNDVDVLAALIDGFAKGHPAENHPRSIEKLRDAFFGNEPLAHVLLAEKNGHAIGFAAWRKTYDVFWSMSGGEGIGLYLSPAHRGSGAALCLIAAMCAEIRKAGGRFLQTSYAPELSSLYERVGVGTSERACHVSALAFEKLADAAGTPARRIIRGLPDKASNYVQRVSP
jgi:N-acetylglutamate synthase-like GNAT family acetyltransferase